MEALALMGGVDHICVVPTARVRFESLVLHAG